MSTSTLLQTPLTPLHRSLGARLMPFAGWDMPVQFEGVMAEHRATRESAGLFDVSHMGQILVRGENAAPVLERLVPQSLEGLAVGRQRYAFFTNENGGLIDDLMISRHEDALYLIVNAACVEEDLAHLSDNLPDVDFVQVTDRALIALQGPKSARILHDIAPSSTAMRFMDHALIETRFGTFWISRSGYTGEDGFEISVPSDAAEAVARALLDGGAVPVGLGARDSLRLEAGLCLYGSDIGPDTSPVEAGLTWAIQKARRSGGVREGGFPGAARILKELGDGPARQRVGLRPEGRAPVRAGSALFAAPEDDTPIGHVTSGTFSPSLNAPIAMGYVPSDKASPGTRLFAEVRGKRLPLVVSPMPFHPHRYHIA